MLESQYYYQLKRKYITLFGTLFSDILFIRYNQAHTAEIERFKVPIEYGNRERYLQRKVDPDYNRPVSVVLPRMAFEVTDVQYDPSRRINPLLRTPQANNETTVDAGYSGAPYIISFQLSILARYADDADQVIEQILPTFSPSYTITALPLPGLGLIKDIPVNLESVSENIEYEDDYETIRNVLYTLDFTMQVYFYGPIVPTKIIRTAFANTFIDPLLQAGVTVRVSVDQGNNGTFKISDTVYQGTSLRLSTATGIVTDWRPNTSQLFIGGAQGQFQSNVAINAVSSNAQYRLASFDQTPQKVVSIKITPDPITAQPGDAFGYDVQQLEFGNPEL